MSPKLCLLSLPLPIKFEGSNSMQQPTTFINPQKQNLFAKDLISSLVMEGPTSSSPPKIEDIDAPLSLMGFILDHVSPHRVTGSLHVTEKCTQPFKVLHGGLSAMIAEALASMGAYMASGYKRVAGIHLSINHVKSALLGETVHAEATPVSLGNTIQVWEVRILKANPQNPEERLLVSSSQVTLLCNMRVPEHAKDLHKMVKKHSKL